LQRATGWLLSSDFMVMAASLNNLYNALARGVDFLSAMGISSVSAPSQKSP
jgi:hypothetical protein